MCGKSKRLHNLLAIPFNLDFFQILLTTCLWTVHEWFRTGIYTTNK